MTKFPRGACALAAAMLAACSGAPAAPDQVHAAQPAPGHCAVSARLGVTGCSRNGKGAIVAGAFDERIKLTIAQESGSGGAAGWRVSNAQLASGQNVQTLRQIVQENVWFTDGFKQFAESAERLPFDQHTVMGLIAPREVWKALGAPAAMGLSQVGGHPHCQLPAAQSVHVNKFVKRFLLGGQDAGTAIVESDGSFAKDLAAWVDWPTPILR